MKKLFILGSGFTTAFCPHSPNIKDIFDKIHDKDLCETINILRSIGIIDPEIIVSQIIDSLYEFDQKHILESKLARYKMINEISKCFANISADDPIMFSTICEKYFKSDVTKEIFIASFNYDLLFEKCLGNIHYIVPISQNPYIYKENIGNFGFATINKKYRLLKLHGSINWYVNQADRFDLANTFYIDSKTESIESFLKENNPVIVPFTYNKSYFMYGDLFTIIWRQLNILLQEVDEIEIIGYGFPNTDYQIYKLLLSYKEKIKNITVKDDKDNRLHDLFGSKLIIEDAKKYLI